MKRTLPLSRLVMYCDGGANPNPGNAGSGVVCYRDDVLEQCIGTHLRHASNNVAEYTGMIEALKYAKAHPADAVHIYTDSKLVQSQMAGLFKIKNADLLPLWKEACTLRDEIANVTIEHVLRDKNKQADAVATLVQLVKSSFQLKLELEE